MVDTYRTLGNPIDERTAALNLPLPNRLNDSRDDVGRLRTALELIDTAGLEARLAVQGKHCIHDGLVAGTTAQVPR